MDFRELGDQYIKDWPKAQAGEISMESFVQGCLDDAQDNGVPPNTIMRLHIYLRRLIRNQLMEQAQTS